MKAIIIENEYTLDERIEAFLKDNPNLFESVQEELYCLHRSPEGLFQEIMKNDAIIVASTWMYKDQLETFLEAFNNPQLTKTFNFYISDVLMTLNDWNDPLESWRSEPELIELILSLLEKGNKIYSFFENWDSNIEIIDDLNYMHQERKRNPYESWEVLYDKTSNLFYLKDNKHYSLEKIKNDKKNGKSPNEQAMEALGLSNNRIKEIKKYSMNQVFFKPNTELVKWLIEYAGNRIIIDAGCGEKFLLSQQLIKNGATRVVAIDPQINFDYYMMWRQLNMDRMDISFHVMPKKIQDMPEFIQNKHQEILLVFARPCYSDWVEETLNLKGEGVEALYITLPKNLDEYDDLGAWREKAVLLEHKGSSADKEVIYSIK